MNNAEPPLEILNKISRRPPGWRAAALTRATRSMKEELRPVLTCPGQQWQLGWSTASGGQPVTQPDVHTWQGSVTGGHQGALHVRCQNRRLSS
jgi:hypothetical protein